MSAHQISRLNNLIGCITFADNDDDQMHYLRCLYEVADDLGLNQETVLEMLECEGIQ